jgi:outer membrane receptor protein involved in Fe transport
LQAAPGADLVNFERMRIRPWTVFDLRAGWDILRKEASSLRLEINAQNIFDRRFAYNFGSPFEGTHFGHPRMTSGRLTVNFR